jgi:VIT1/CCC1 family predicted Fe2+/Mn2+ transporter
MVEARLRQWTAQRKGERPVITCWFNAWLHDDAPHLGAALAAHVANEANRRRAVWRRLLFPLPEQLLTPGERWRRRAALLIGLLVLTAIAAAAPPTRDAAQQVALPKVSGGSGAGAGSVVVIGFVALILWRKLFAAAQDAAQFVQSPEAEARIGALGRARDQLRRLINQARRDGRFVIIVDDLERCRPPRAIEVCEVASQLLAHQGVVTLLLADMASVAASAEMKYKDFADANGTRRVGREYLEKMVQLQLTLPPPRPVDMAAMLTDRPPILRPTSLERLRRSARTSISAPRRSYPPELAEFVVAAVAAALLSWAAASIGTGVIVSLVVALLVPVVVALVTSLLAAQRRRRGARARRRIDERIRALATNTDQDALAERLLAETETAERALARKQLDSYLTDHAHELGEVEEVIVDHPPALPRSAKRMLNHARMLTRIARDRGLFGGDPPLTPRHLGKWIVLSERWREIAEAVTADPGLMKRLERSDNLGAVLKSDRIREAPSPGLQALLASQPALSQVVERLVYVEPAQRIALEEPSAFVALAEEV